MPSAPRSGVIDAHLSIQVTHTQQGAAAAATTAAGAPPPPLRPAAEATAGVAVGGSGIKQGTEVVPSGSAGAPPPPGPKPNAAMREKLMVG